MKITEKLIIIFLLVSLVPISIFGIFSYSNAQTTFLKEFHDRIESLTVIQENRLLDITSHNEELLFLFTTRPQLRQTIAAYNQSSDSSPNKLADKNAINTILQETTQEIDAFKEIHILNLSGEVIASTKETMIGSNHSQDEFFIKGKEGKDVSHIFKDDKGNIRIHLTGPIVYQGTTIAVADIETDTQKLFNLTNDYRGLGATGETFFAKKDSNGDALVLTPLRFDKNAALQKIIVKDETNPITRALQRKEDVFSDTIDYRGKKVLSATRFLSKLDWGMVVKIDQDEMYAPLTTLNNFFIGIFVALALLVSMFAFLFARSLTSPLRKLTEVAEKIAHGDFSQVASVKSKDELGQLASAFNAMAEKLQELYSGLEKKVQEKTAELQKEKESVEQKVVERTQQLSYEQDRLQASINSLSVGYVMTGSDNKVILINSAAEDIMTLSTRTARPAQKAIDVTELRGKIDIDYIQNALKEHLNLFEQIEEAKNKKANIILKDIPYKMLTLNLFIAPIISKETHITIGTVMLIEDVTERKVLDRSRDEFFSIASHELRTPLTAIRGNASIIMDYFFKEIQNQEIKDIVSDIHESSLRLIDIVNDFLDMSRLEQGKVQYESEPFEIDTLCKDVIKEYDVTGSRKKLYLRIDQPTATIPLVYADKNRTREVLVNLVGNSIKFTQQGGVSILFKTEENHIKVFVTDTGAGISEDNKNLLFRKFQQAETNILTRDNTKGTGLGLYISRLMMKDMGGDIALEKSGLGQGSTFSVTIPFATKSQTDEFATKIKPI